MTCVKLILDNQDKETIGAKVNIKNKAGDSAIILAGKGATENNDITKQFIDAIVEKGAYIFDSNTNTTNPEYGKTALMHAMSNEDLRNYILLNELIVLANNLNRSQRIVEDKSNVDAFTDKLTQLPKDLWFNKNVFGETILIRLADKGNSVLVNTLLKDATTGQVNTRNKNGNSAIILTGRSDQSYNIETKKIIDALIAKGADINDRNKPEPKKHQGQTAYMLALDNNNQDLYNYINRIQQAKHNAITQRGGKRTAKKSSKSRKMRKRKSRKTRRVR
jgi:ankyrin repeat protein